MSADVTREAAASPTNALAVPAFRYFWINGVTFFLAANSLRFVYGWVVLDGLNQDEAWQGFIVFILGIPSLFLLMPAGVWADRFDPKRLLVASQWLLVFVLAGTALVLGEGAGSLVLLVGSAILSGIVTAVGTPVRQSLIPALLSGPLLYSGIALNAIAITLSMVLGAVAARQFGEWFGFDGAFWWLVALVIVGLVAIARMESPGPSSRSGAGTADGSARASADDSAGAAQGSGSMRDAIGEGVRFVWENRAIRTLFWLLAISGFFMSPVMFVTIQAHVKSELGRTAADAAPVLALMGLGLASTSLFIMRAGDMANKGVKFMRAMIGGTSTVTLMGLTTAYWQMLVLGFVMGTCGGFFINMNQGLIQSNTPAEVMGRVMGIYALVQVGLTPFGAVFFGIVAARIGTGNTIFGAGICALGLVVITYLRSRSLRELP